MSSVHLYQAEKKDFQKVFDLLINFKEVDLVDVDLPEVDKPKLTNFINAMLQKGKIILAKELDQQELIGCCIFHKSEYWFSKQQLINIHVLYIKQKYRNFKLVKTLIDSVKNVADDLPIVMGVTTKIEIGVVLEKLGFENMGGNWRLA
jgi:N-acetylglutamate synthase-like GNAT family acetyltransferase